MPLTGTSGQNYSPLLNVETAETLRQSYKQNVYIHLLKAQDCSRVGLNVMQDYALDHAAKNMVAYYFLSKKAS